MMHPVKRVLVTGSESTGKTRLCEELAKHYRTTWCPEYLREYFDQHGGRLRLEDQVPIAIEHARREDEATKKADRVCFTDTDAILTCVYFDHYFGHVNPKVLELADRERYDLVLLLHPDVPWVIDPQRDLREGRTRIHDRVREEMEKRGMSWVDVKGSWDMRWRTATKAVDAMLSEVP
jgi:NadR type nicotinamide-nucleotide adenylyltransferase